MGRYAERCEDKTRLLRASMALRHNLPFWPQAMEVCKEFGVSALFETDKPFSLSRDIGRLGACAAQARGNLSAENWRVLTVLQREFRRDEAARRDARDTLDRLLLSLVALAGFALDDMTQDDGWRLMMIARRLERLQFLSRLIALRLESATVLRSELEWLLEIGDSAITYRTRHHAAPVWDLVIELLVYDDRNPRALAFQWQAIGSLLTAVAESLGYRSQDTLDEPVARLFDLQGAKLGGETEMGRSARRRLAERLTDLNAAAGLLSDQLSSQHFSHVDFDQRAVSA
jgi:uncharacterized alpha-E superfamily protein